MNSLANGTDLAVVGMAGRFPGAPNLTIFWQNLCGGFDAIRPLSEAELLAAGEDPEQLRDPAYVRACPVLDGLDMFDAAFFGWNPRDAAITDPQHRVFLELAWEAFENAAIDVSKHVGPVSVFAACGMNSYMMYNLVTNREVMETVGEWLVRHTGNDMNFLATRVSYELDLRGPSMTVQTACSSALVAIHAACQSLLNGESDLALAGGCTILLPHGRGYLHKEGEILSPDGKCRPFDARSAGTVFGSGGGCVVLRRLDDAVASGDHIYAVIKGSAVNNDGAQKVGYLAPSVEGQAAAVSEALALTGIDPETIGYVEAHGTATEIGDPIEIAALTQAYRAHTEKKGFCAIGSLKSNMGHLGEAAGVAGFIKTALALKNKRIPPSLHYERPNPHIDFANSPFFVNSRLSEWAQHGDEPRRAGITALGAGGTNVHVIVEEAPAAAPSGPSRDHQLIVLSAKTPAALDAATANLGAYLRNNPSVALADVAYTLHVGRRAMPCRRALVCRADARSGAVTALEALDPGQLLTATVPAGDPSVVLMFPGGGAQYASMGADLYASEEVYRESIDACLDIARRLGLADLRSLLFPKPAEAEAATKRLESPSLALPALFATEYALAKLLFSWGIEPAAMIGHSMGEYVAACLADVFSLRDGMALVALRGRLFETLPRGAMLSVPLPEAEARAHMGPDLSFAAINGPSLCVVSGPAPAVDQLEKKLSNAGVDTTRVHIDVAAHSSMLEPILPEFERFCRTIVLRAPKTPYVSNLTGTWITEAQATDPTYWVRHLRHTVRFADGLATLLSEPGRVLVEVGPGRTLSSLAQQQPQKPRAALSTVRHPSALGSDVAVLLTALGRLWLAGVEPDWTLFYQRQERRRLPLPTYPFQRKRHWIDAPSRNTSLAPSGASRVKPGELRKRPDIANWFHLPSWKRTLPPTGGAAPEGPSLVFLDACGLGEAIASRLPSSVRVTPGERFGRGADGVYTIRPSVRADLEALWKDLQTRRQLPTKILHLWALTQEPVMPLGAAQSLLFDSLFLLGQVLSQEEHSADLTVVSNHLHDVAGEGSVVAEKSLLLGPCRVMPREMPGVRVRSVDVVLPPVDRRALVLEQLLAELNQPPGAPIVAYRGRDRWVQTFEHVHIPPAKSTPRIRNGGVFLITGGLGGIGMELAEDLARAANNAKLVLIARTPPPPADKSPNLLETEPDSPAARRVQRILALQKLGAEVVVEAADVRDPAQVEAVVRRARERFGAVHGVIHAAGAIDDGLMVMKTLESAHAVLGAKVEGALALEAALRGQPLDFFVLFSSVSSLLGLQGQVDYAAANAFLDAFARVWTQREVSPAVAVNWGAWQNVGMVVSIASHQRPAAAPTGEGRPTDHPLLERAFASAGEVVYTTTLRREDVWLLREHVIRGAEALIPGTGHLEIARAALELSAEPALINPATGAPKARAVEIRDLVFLAPLAVKSGESRTMRVTLHRSTSELTISSLTTDHPPGEAPVVHVKAHVAHVEMPHSASIQPDKIRERCPTRETPRDRFMNQTFLDFGPRWANIRECSYGTGEALLNLELGAEWEGDLAVFKLHPALLDMATGSAQALIPGFDREKDFFVPFSYGRVLLRSGLPRRLWSHVQLGEATADTATFQVTLAAEDGTAIAHIQDFVMRRVRDRTTMAGGSRTGSTHTGAGSTHAESTHAGSTHADSTHAGGGSTHGKVAAPDRGGAPQTSIPHAADTALTVFTQGMLPAEGLDVFHRILAANVAPQIIATSIDLDDWMASAGAPDRPAPEATSDSQTATPRAARPGLSTPFVAPRDDLEKAIAEIWQKMLGLEQVGVHDDFFEVGGYSLLLTQTATRVRKMAGVDIPLRSLFARPTIDQIAAEIRKARGGAAPKQGSPMTAVSRDAYRVKRSEVGSSKKT
ncbi:MAG: SDR family NAD(P)-dependent oxidoreductase [Polyangiaceae bacterium]|nr:SDR family NAD(P)-dependent oxidoreductase [Polyangiaceae bacterium]